MDIAGLCLPLKPQKERSSAIIDYRKYFQGYTINRYRMKKIREKFFGKDAYVKTTGRILRNHAFQLLRFKG
jgi:hypothetical protein